MDKQKMQEVAEAYKAQMLAIDSNFPISVEGMALAVWTRMTPIQRYEIMTLVEKIPKTLPAKQKACVKKIMEIIK